jgi:hypothetical protein
MKGVEVHQHMEGTFPEVAGASSLDWLGVAVEEAGVGRAHRRAQPALPQGALRSDHFSCVGRRREQGRRPGSGMRLE